MINRSVLGFDIVGRNTLKPLVVGGLARCCSSPAAHARDRRWQDDAPNVTAQPKADPGISRASSPQLGQMQSSLSSAAAAVPDAGPPA